MRKKLETKEYKIPSFSKNRENNIEKGVNVKMSSVNNLILFLFLL